MVNSAELGSSRKTIEQKWALIEIHISSVVPIVSLIDMGSHIWVGVDVLMDFLNTSIQVPSKKAASSRTSPFLSVLTPRAWFFDQSLQSVVASTALNLSSFSLQQMLLMPLKTSCFSHPVFFSWALSSLVHLFIFSWPLSFNAFLNVSLMSASVHILLTWKRFPKQNCSR